MTDHDNERDNLDALDRMTAFAKRTALMSSASDATMDATMNKAMDEAIGEAKASEAYRAVTIGAPGYDELALTLADAFLQASAGKGSDRHANGRRFTEQPICTIGRMLASTCDGEIYQAMKKGQEASNMLAKGKTDAAVAELLGAINYLASCVILIREPNHG